MPCGFLLTSFRYRSLGLDAFLAFVDCAVWHVFEVPNNWFDLLVCSAKNERFPCAILISFGICAFLNDFARWTGDERRSLVSIEWQIGFLLKFQLRTIKFHFECHTGLVVNVYEVASMCVLCWWHYNGAHRMTHSSLYSWPTFRFESCFFHAIIFTCLLRAHDSNQQFRCTGL